MQTNKSTESKFVGQYQKVNMGDAVNDNDDVSGAMANLSLG